MRPFTNNAFCVFVRWCHCRRKAPQMKTVIYWTFKFSIYFILRVLCNFIFFNLSVLTNSVIVLLTIIACSNGPYELNQMFRNRSWYEVHLTSMRPPLPTGSRKSQLKTKNVDLPVCFYSTGRFHVKKYVLLYL